jgi:hypothetical protein
MARTKLSPEFEINVGGEAYVWRLQRLPQWSTDSHEWRGKAIAVRHKDGQREAVVEFPSGPPPKFGASPLKPAQIPKRLIETAIASAIAAGWNPMSRGRPVTIVVDETGA